MKLIQFSKSRWINPEQVLRMTIHSDPTSGNAVLVVVTSVNTHTIGYGYVPQRVGWYPDQQSSADQNTPSPMYTATYPYASLDDAEQAAANIENQRSITRNER